MATVTDGRFRRSGIDACPRCGGLLVAEPALDLAVEGLDGEAPSVGVGGASAGPPLTLDAPARRCVQCGEVIDPVILRNRRTAQALLHAEEQTSHSALSTEKRS